MSQKKYKNKSHLLAEEIDRLELEPFKHSVNWWNSYYFYDDDDWYNWGGFDCDICGRFDCDYYNCLTYDYLPIPDLDWKIKLGKSGRITFNNASLYGSYINMDTIYTKEVIRDRKIEILLGLRKPFNSKPNLGDLYEERRNI